MRVISNNLIYPNFSSFTYPKSSNFLSYPVMFGASPSDSEGSGSGKAGKGKKVRPHRTVKMRVFHAALSVIGALFIFRGVAYQVRKMVEAERAQNATSTNANFTNSTNLTSTR